MLAHHVSATRRGALPGHGLGQLGEDMVDDVGRRCGRCRQIGFHAGVDLGRALLVEPLLVGLGPPATLG